MILGINFYSKRYLSASKPQHNPCHVSNHPMIETKSHQSVKSINSGYLTKDRWFCVRVRLLPVNGSRLVRDQMARTHPMFGTLNYMYGTPNTPHTKPWYIHHMYDTLTGIYGIPNTPHTKPWSPRIPSHARPIICRPNMSTQSPVIRFIYIL